MDELTELFKAVREENLVKTDLEKYRDKMAEILASMQMECANLEKEEAIYMNGKGVDETAINRKITWKATPYGQRLIVLKRYISATKTMMTSLRDRLYNFY